MTHNEVAALFQAYNIKLGCGDLDAPTIVTALKELDMSAFDKLIKQAFDNMKQQGFEHALRIVRNDLGQLVVQWKYSIGMQEDWMPLKKDEFLGIC